MRPPSLAPHPSFVDNTIAGALATEGWAVVPDFFDAAATAALAVACRGGWQAGDFRAARIGAGLEAMRQADVRGDHIRWLEPAELESQSGGMAATDTDPVRAYFARMERLRLVLNRTLYLGLVELEAHFAVYPPGAGYDRHLDRHRGQPARTVSTVLYLNADWGRDDGGELRLYLGSGGNGAAAGAGDGEAIHDVAPVGGTLAVFLSGEVEHAVRPARRDRLSVTGWFRVRG